MPFSPSEGQKTNALDEVFYEIEQLVSLATHRNFDRNLNNAVVESNLLHLRNLRDFFNHSAREKDEVLASDYGFPHSPIDIPRKYSERLNKDLAHITYSRVSRSEADKAWPYDLVIFPVLSRCGSFIRHLIANRSTYGKYGADLWRQLVERIEALPSPSDPASMNLSAATSSVQVNVRESFK